MVNAGQSAISDEGSAQDKLRVILPVFADREGSPAKRPKDSNVEAHPVAHQVGREPSFLSGMDDVVRDGADTSITRVNQLAWELATPL